MHAKDSKILPTDGVEEGRVIIHPHSKEAYVFCGHEWHVIHDGDKDVTKKIKDDAYKRAMSGI